MKTTKMICKDNEVSWYDGYHTKWYSEEEIRLKILDMYRLMCNEYGKANIWSMDTDELLDNVELLIEKKLFGGEE